MRLVADANLALLDETFARHGKLERLDGRKIQRKHLQDADVLLLRSVTRVDAELLEGTPVRFVGTATIGTDHLDIEWLDKNGISWAYAPGCNADAAAQYTLALLWEACRRTGRSPHELTVGIVGGGNVGSRLRHLLEALRIPCVVCDPPLAALGHKGLVSYEQALAQPLVSFHVPLTRTGPCPTYHLLDSKHLALLPDRAILINTSRGDVIKGPDLLAELQFGRLHAALDVWPGEPRLNPDLLARAAIATPHVAGYSVEGKQNGTLMIYRAFCDWLGDHAHGKFETGNPLSKLRIDSPEDLLSTVLNKICGVAADDQQMRAAFSGPPDDFARAFDQLRKSYRLRHDFSGWEITGAPASACETLRYMGLNIGTG